MSSTSIDPLTGPTAQQAGESDAKYAYRHAYRYAYGNPANNDPATRHSTARAYGEWVECCFLAQPSLMGEWSHADHFPAWLVR